MAEEKAAGHVEFLTEVESLAQRLQADTGDLSRAADKAADTIASGHWVRLFGSGHSVIPVLDCFPRYGGFVGFYPMMDPRLMWATASGPGGAEELLWLERQEGYIQNFLQHQQWQAEDMLIVISHGGQNAAPVEVARQGKNDGLYVVALTSGENHRTKSSTHSSGQKIGDVADLVLDNGVHPEDAVVSVPGVAGKVGGLSTLAAIVLIQSLVSETAKRLADRGHPVTPFASPNVDGVEADRGKKVYEQYRRRLNGPSSIG